ncbi:MAG: 1-(5-phosphoribosyl)-5-[(5-phosphoribosylamino)methylideneamino]imidazole-4-carboxamide isomerase [Bacteroidales bacterium]|jgi:phosphoribosylformimino-5-aminoimidazole carboxamide ribotide isomerase|nr:1-(5-phosphoribosyl)-5-[(5-phosphoribosylamino)methylideneamino]imidazole-4-carboxamide isomerase [Bacteroidales bacterium]
MRIIPAMDIIDGACVRLTQGDYSRKTLYSREPVEVAKELESHGFKYLHLVDLDGAREGQIRNHGVLEAITDKTGLKVDFSGGIRNDDDLRTVFGCGASQVTCGSVAVTQPSLFLRWLADYGPEKIILGADFRQRKVAAGGWLSGSDTDVMTFLRKYRSEGVVYAMCTDIEKDGMLEGSSVEIYKEIVQIEGLSLIASGGITTLEEILILRDTGCEAAIIGKAIYEGKFSLEELAGLC